ncbi:MAG TPA: type I-U CRISPR-associated protein Csb2 [Gemmataceae bacterium]
MSLSYFCVSVAFLDSAFHGRRDGGELEWPPSPLRLFQALVAASAARWRESLFHESAVPALKWLERQPAPDIITPEAAASSAYRISVPNNAMDIVAAAWARGNYTSKDAQPATHRAMKPVRAMRMLDGESVRYLWQLPDPLTEEVRGFVETLSAASDNLVALGWGIDLVAGNGRIVVASQAEKLAGQRWRPTNAPSDDALRVPVPGTFEALLARHQTFLSRLVNTDNFMPVPTLSVFDSIGYRQETEPASRPVAVFSILKMDACGFRPFDPVRRTHIVAAMIRHAAAESAVSAGWSRERINTLIHGHTPDGAGKSLSENGLPRLSYIPLPSIEERGHGKNVVSSIRRVLVAGPLGSADEIGWARRALNGQELIEERTKRPSALLSLLPMNDGRIRRYLDPSSVWATVTPVVLPGYDDGNPTKTEKRLRTAIKQAEFPSLLADQAILEWRQVGFFPGLDLARRSLTPAHLEAYPRYHVRLRWPAEVKVSGPIVIGGGRYCGLGLFAAMK